MKSFNVLVVEDEFLVREMLRAGLAQEGYKVECAPSAKAALRRLSQMPAIDVVTLDVRLNGDDGREVAKYIRSHLNIPILMISALGSPRDRVSGLDSGADDYVSKPFDMREVVLRIRNLLRTREDLPADPPNT